MTSNIVLAEQQLVKRVAQNYSTKGYEVIVQPHGDDLPVPLRRYHPDVLAQRDDDTVIVEVRSRGKVRRTDYWRELKTAVEECGWRFELIVNTAPDVQSISREEIDNLLQQSSEISERYPASGLMAAWSAMEAVMRAVLDHYRVQPSDYKPATLIAQLQIEGLVSDETYEFLREGLALRNAVAHGYQGKVNPSFVDKLVDLAQGLVSITEQTDEQ